MLSRLCRVATHEAGLAGAVVTVLNTDGLHIVLGSSDEASRRREEIQFSLGEGPGFDAFDLGRPVLVPDLQRAAERWPGYTTEAVKAGIGAVYTFPVQFGAVRFGVLTAYCDAPRALQHHDSSSLLVFSELATDLLLNSVPDPTTYGVPVATEVPDRHPDAERHHVLQDALHLRSEIYQAQGMVMVQLGVSLVEALAVMRARAFAAGTDLTSMAVGIIDGTIRLVDE